MPLPQPHPNLDALDLLASVSELGSISAAARAHRITQPAASMRLRSLEDALQVQLLVRSKTGAKLTPAGVATVEWAGAVLREVRTLLAGTTALRAGQSSHLDVAASLTVAEYLIPRWLEQFATQTPDVNVSLQMGNTTHVIELVEGGEVELGFIEGRTSPGRLPFKEVAQDELVVVAGVGHPWSRRRGSLSPEDLARTPLVLRETGSGTRDVLAAALADRGLTLTPAMELGSTTAIKAAVIAGRAPAVVSLLAVGAELRNGRLVTVACAGIDLRRVIRAIWSADRQRSRPARQLIQIAGADLSPAQR